jgi:Flp pilus assembly protein TadD
LRRMRTRRARALVQTLIALLVAAAAFASMRRSAVWRSNLALWADTVLKNTTDGLPARSLATAFLKQGDAAQAAVYFRLALQRRNDRAGLLVIHNNLGSLAMQEKDLDEAERQYRTALEIEPQSADAIFNLGLIALTRATHARDTGDSPAALRQAAEARSHFERALQLNPYDADTHIALGQTLTLLAEPAAARRHYEEALHLGTPPPTAEAVRRLLAGLD